MNGSYLKPYSIKIKTLGPVFIGSGKMVNKTEYVRNGNNVYIIDPKKLMSLIVEKRLTQSYTSEIQKKFNLKNWLIKNRINDYESISAYVLGLDEIADENKKGMSAINTCIKDAYSRPYIPGSSLKGALRTVMLWNQVYDNYDKLSDFRSNIDNALTNNDKRAMKRNIEAISKELENHFFTHKKENIEYSIMRGCIISDSKPLSLDDITLCEKTDLKDNGQKNTLNILRECIKPGTVIELDMTIDERIFKYDAETLEDMIKNYSADYFDIVVSEFPGGEDTENTIYLGGGSGYFSKTVSYRLFDKRSAVRFVKGYLSKTTPREHRHSQDRRISPHTYKTTRYNGKLYDMGKCSIEIRNK